MLAHLSAQKICERLRDNLPEFHKASHKLTTSKKEPPEEDVLISKASIRVGDNQAEWGSSSVADVILPYLARSSERV